jgi:hypothetical protein
LALFPGPSLHSCANYAQRLEELSRGTRLKFGPAGMGKVSSAHALIEEDYRTMTGADKRLGMGLDRRGL